MLNVSFWDTNERANRMSWLLAFANPTPTATAGAGRASSMTRAIAVSATSIDSMPAQ
jgi:hypothetical protein